MKLLKNFSAWFVCLIGALAMISTSATAQNTPKVTDPEIAHIVVTANQIDVNYGKIALKKTTNKDAIAFAKTMIKDHESLIKSTLALGKKLGVTAKDNAVSKSLVKGEKDITAKLNKLKGKAFTKFYIDNEVTYHEAVIATVKNVLIPQATNSELKETLIKVTPLLEHHLEMAKMAQAKIK
jgi:putative membrane protein